MMTVMLYHLEIVSVRSSSEDGMRLQSQTL